MLISNTWLLSLIFSASVFARVTPEARRNACYTDSCSKALLQNANGAASFCHAFEKTGH